MGQRITKNLKEKGKRNWVVGPTGEQTLRGQFVKGMEGGYSPN